MKRTACIGGGGARDRAAEASMHRNASVGGRR